MDILEDVVYRGVVFPVEIHVSEEEKEWWEREGKKVYEEMTPEVLLPIIDTYNASPTLVAPCFNKEGWMMTLSRKEGRSGKGKRRDSILIKGKVKLYYMANVEESGFLSIIDGDIISKSTEMNGEDGRVKVWMQDDIDQASSSLDTHATTIKGHRQRKALLPSRFVLHLVPTAPHEKKREMRKNPTTT